MSNEKYGMTVRQESSSDSISSAKDELEKVLTPLTTSQSSIDKAFDLIAGTLDVEKISEKELEEIKDIRMKILKGLPYK